MGKYKPTRREKFNRKVRQVSAENAIMQMAQLYQAPFKVRLDFCYKLLFRKRKGKK